MEHSILREPVVSVMMIGLLFLVAFASARREKAADAAPVRIPGVRR